jgi:hypothetical protein
MEVIVRTTGLLALGVALLMPLPTQAQQFTAEQQQVVDFIEHCWETWGTESWSAYERACRTDPTARFWWFAESVPNAGIAEWRRWAAAFWPRIESQVHYEIRPLTVQVFGDVALYYYWASWSHVDANGELQTMAQHRLEILQRRDGQWLWIGGSGGPAPGQ